MSLGRGLTMALCSYCGGHEFLILSGGGGSGGVGEMKVICGKCGRENKMPVGAEVGKGIGKGAEAGAGGGIVGKSLDGQVLDEVREEVGDVV